MSRPPRLRAASFLLLRGVAPSSTGPTDEGSGSGLKPSSQCGWPAPRAGTDPRGHPRLCPSLPPVFPVPRPPRLREARPRRAAPRLPAGRPLRAGGSFLLRGQRALPGRGGAGGAGAGTGPGPAGPPPRQSPLSARPAGAATPPAPSRLHPLQRLVRGSAAGPGGGGGRLFAFVAAPESRNPAPLGRPEAGPRAPRRFGRALVFYGPRADRCACRSAFPWRRPVLRRQTVKLHFRAEGERGKRGA